MSENEALKKLKNISQKNEVFRNFIGMGYYNTITPQCYFKKYFRKSRLVYFLHSLSARSSSRKIRNVVQFSTDDYGFNRNGYCKCISLLDEGTAAAEAMGLCHRI